MIIIDTEIYSNYFLLSAMDSKTKKIKHFELYDNHPLDVKSILGVMRSYETLGFNSNNFDLPIIALALSGADNAKIKKLSDSIIKSNMPAWRIAKDFNVSIPTNWNHIDIIEVAIGQASLKIYGARLNAPTIQDLPIEPNAVLTREQMKLIREYCENDLHTTNLLYDALKPQVDLRVSMSEQYGIDLRSKSDAQIAEAVIISELNKLTGKEYKRQQVQDGQTYNYTDPKIITFKSPELNALFNRIIETDFELGVTGSIVLPDWLKDYDLKINGTAYNIGIGGLHSCEKSQFVRADNNNLLIDLDVASYYPNIILQQKISPKSMGTPFLKIYQSIVDRRIKAKKTGDKVTADVLKICVNGSFGKLGSKYSTLYAPELMIQTTITGQLALLMLIERIELAGIKVISANTDGIVMHCQKEKESTLEAIAFDWMLDTSFELERTDYKALASRDVNNYIAVKTDGKTKGKGLYAPSGLAKNPDFNICCEAVARFVANDIPLETTIRECKDITKFVSVRKVTGGAKWRNEFLGKAVRFYKSMSVPETENIHYANNSNKVPNSNGAKPLMTLPDTFPTDVDYKFYINRAEEHLIETGYR